MLDWLLITTVGYAKFVDTFCMWLLLQSCVTSAVHDHRSMRQFKQTDVLLAPGVPPIYQRDYIIALVLNEAGEALVWERQKPGGGACWQMLEQILQAHEDPFTAVQQALLAQTGRQTEQWAYLGSHVVDASQPVGIGYFFCAQKSHEVGAAAQEWQTPDGEPLCPKWVSLTDLRYALLDGRLTVTRHALVVSISLLTILK